MAPGASSASAVRFLQRGGVGGSSSSSSVRESSLPVMSRTLSGVQRGVAADDDRSARNCAAPPRCQGGRVGRREGRRGKCDLTGWLAQQRAMR